MSNSGQWLELGLAQLPAGQANRVRVFRLLLASASALRTRLDQQLAPAGITTGQAALLQWIEAQPEAPTLSAVAAGMGKTHQNVKQIAAALQRKGFLQIVVDASDRRARRLQLTEGHHQFWASRNPQDFSRLEDWTSVWSDAEVAQLVALLQRLQPADEAASAATG